MYLSNQIFASSHSTINMLQSMKREYLQRFTIGTNIYMFFWTGSKFILVQILLPYNFVRVGAGRGYYRQQSKREFTRLATW